MHRRRFLALSALVAAGRAIPTSAEDPKSKLRMSHDGKIHTGGSRMIEIGGGRRVWTKKVGASETEVLLLHGGPGADRCYFVDPEKVPLRHIEVGYFELRYLEG